LNMERSTTARCAIVDLRMSNDHRELTPAPKVTSGPTFWRSLDEIADREDFQRWVYEEFPAGVLDELSGVTRRQFLKIMAASFALGGVGCSPEPRQRVVPHVDEPAEESPGRPIYYASALPIDGYAQGVLVATHQGRPTKLEGNPQHPLNQGAGSAMTQAEILRFYDPERSQSVHHDGRISTWQAFERRVAALRERWQTNEGEGVAILTGNLTSPTQLAELEAFFEQYPQARWHVHEPIGWGNVKQGTTLAFGQTLEPTYDLSQASRIVSLDCDFLWELPESLRYARQWANRRRTRKGRDFDPARMNRVYVVEPTPSVTGSNADHALASPAGRVPELARALAQRLDVDVPGPAVRLNENEAEWVKAAAADLRAVGSAGVVMAGRRQNPEVHALASWINERLGSTGRCAKYREPISAAFFEQPGTLTELVEALRGGDIETLLMLETNPVYSAPAGLDFPTAMARAAETVHLGLYRDETGQQATWHLPLGHPLEVWSDARSGEGVASVIQPTVRPLYAGRTAHEILAIFNGRPYSTSQELVRAHWERWWQREREHSNDRQHAYEAWWDEILAAGVIDGTEARALLPEVNREGVREAWAARHVPENEGLELVLAPDPTIWDGRFANNGWLQELPKSLSKLTWDNALFIHPERARKLGVQQEQRVTARFDRHELTAAVWLMPGQARNSVTLTLGYGREAAGQVGTAQGFNAYRLRPRENFWYGQGLQVEPMEASYSLATTQHHHRMEERAPARFGGIDKFAASRAEARAIGHPEQSEEHISLYPEYAYDNRLWGMTIDLSTCIGCGACTVACQAENNIPVVGKEQVRKGREMHWIRVDRYYEGDHSPPRTLHQPVPCMHCQKAPCEVVCPVAATTHSHDGLNEMIYNRCVGTRYCSNNCPYKVRRFNFYDFVREEPEVYKLLRNPDVSVRSRGVMEKCTYCVQRIRRAEIAAKVQDRTLSDGEIVTACQEVCPTEAIVFGDTNDPRSQVSRNKAEPHNYGLLEELNTQPQTTYLAAISNPHPDLRAR